MDQERRIRREIANSNERRRMQSINSGFQSLRTLLPHHEGEKLSKVRKLNLTKDANTDVTDKMSQTTTCHRQQRSIYSNIYIFVVF
jgi:hypothetical protein